MFFFQKRTTFFPNHHQSFLTAVGIRWASAHRRLSSKLPSVGQPWPRGGPIGRIQPARHPPRDARMRPAQAGRAPARRRKQPKPSTCRPARSQALSALPPIRPRPVYPPGPRTGHRERWPMVLSGGRQHRSPPLRRWSRVRPWSLPIGAARTARPKTEIWRQQAGCPLRRGPQLAARSAFSNARACAPRPQNLTFAIVPNHDRG
jgi:hypothetical protein